MKNIKFKYYTFYIERFSKEAYVLSTELRFVLKGLFNWINLELHSTHFSEKNKKYNNIEKLKIYEKMRKDLLSKLNLILNKGIFIFGRYYEFSFIMEIPEEEYFINYYLKIDHDEIVPYLPTRYNGRSEHPAKNFYY